MRRHKALSTLTVLDVVFLSVLITPFYLCPSSYPPVTLLSTSRVLAVLYTAEGELGDQVARSV